MLNRVCEVLRMFPPLFNSNQRYRKSSRTRPDVSPILCVTFSSHKHVVCRYVVSCLTKILNYLKSVRDKCETIFQVDQLITQELSDNVNVQAAYKTETSGKKGTTKPDYF